MSAHRDIAQRIIRDTFPTRWQAWPDSNGPDCALACVVPDERCSPSLEADSLWVVARIDTPKHGRETFAIHAPTGRIFGREVPGSSGSAVRSWKIGDLPTHMRGSLSAPVRGCQGGAGALGTLHPTLVRVLDPEAEADAKKRARSAQKDVPVSKANGATAPAFSRPAPPPPPSLAAKRTEETRVTLVQEAHKVDVTLAQLLALVRFASGGAVPDDAVVRVVWSDRPEEPALAPADLVSVRWITTREE